MLSETGLATATARGRERHYRLRPEGLAAIHDWLATLGPAPRFAESALDGLDLEVRRTGRERPDHTAARTAEKHDHEEIG